MYYVSSLYTGQKTWNLQFCESLRMLFGSNTAQKYWFGCQCVWQWKYYWFISMWELFNNVLGLVFMFIIEVIVKLHQSVKMMSLSYITLYNNIYTFILCRKGIQLRYMICDHMSQMKKKILVRTYIFATSHIIHTVTQHILDFI